VRVFSFVEGANPSKGGLGLVGVPWIARSLAERGHQVVLNLAGSANPGTEHWVQPDVPTALRHGSGLGNYGIVRYPCFSRQWAFSPSMFNSLLPYIRDVDFITLHSLYSFPVLAGYLLARRFRKPYGIWPHGVLAPAQREISARKKELYDGLVAKRILNQASVIFYSAVGEREEAHALHLRPPTAIVPHGLDVQPYVTLPLRGVFRARYLSGHTGPLVLYLSRLNAKKGLDLLSRAFTAVCRAFPDARLAIVGGSDPPQFESQVRIWLQESGIDDRTVITGFVTDQQKREAFADADVFVLPSQAENFGFALFEAMASNLSVVVSDTLNYADEIERYQAGIIVPREPQEFARAIMKLLANSGLRWRMGSAGARLANMYTWDRSGEQMERAIHCILDRTPLTTDLTNGARLQ
jgi:glycosyltransferase involved in cell wall biosynthesis